MHSNCICFAGFYIFLCNNVDMDLLSWAVSLVLLPLLKSRVEIALWE